MKDFIIKLDDLAANKGVNQEEARSKLMNSIVKTCVAKVNSTDVDYFLSQVGEQEFDHEEYNRLKFTDYESLFTNFTFSEEDKQEGEDLFKILNDLNSEIKAIVRKKTHMGVLGVDLSESNGIIQFIYTFVILGFVIFIFASVYYLLNTKKETSSEIIKRERAEKKARKNKNK